MAWTCAIFCKFCDIARYLAIISIFCDKTRYCKISGKSMTYSMYACTWLGCDVDTRGCSAVGPLKPGMTVTFSGVLYRSLCFYVLGAFLPSIPGRARDADIRKSKDMNVVNKPPMPRRSTRRTWTCYLKLYAAHVLHITTLRSRLQYVSVLVQ